MIRVVIGLIIILTKWKMSDGQRWMDHIDWTATEQQLCAKPINETQIIELSYQRDNAYADLVNMYTHYKWIRYQIKNQTDPALKFRFMTLNNAILNRIINRLEELRIIDTYLKAVGQYTHSTKDNLIARIERLVSYPDTKRHVKVETLNLAYSLFREPNGTEDLNSTCILLPKPKTKIKSAYKVGTFAKYSDSSSTPVLAQPSGEGSTVAHQKSVFRPAYGMNFKYSGQIVHGVTKYLIAVAVNFPVMDWDSVKIPWPKFNCSKRNVALYSEMVSTCEDMNMVFRYNDARAIDAATQAQTILEQNIPGMLIRRLKEESIPIRPGRLRSNNAIIPDIDSQTYYPRLDPTQLTTTIAPVAQPQVAAAASMAVKAIQMAPKVVSIGKQAYKFAKQGIKAFEKVRKFNLFRRLSDYISLPSKNRARIESIEQGLAALTERTTKSLNVVYKKLSDLTGMTNSLARKVDMLQLKSTHLALSAKRMAIMEGVLNDARMLQSGVQQLINGHLDPNILPPTEFQKMMDYVHFDLQLHYPDYQPALPDIGQYYETNIMQWTMENGVLMMIIPVMIRHRLENPMDLYRMQIISMPYFSSPNRPKEQDGRVAYTRLELDHDMLIMDEYRNAPYRSEDLEDCVKMEGVYYCDDLHLVYISNIPNCAASIYHNGDPELIARSCPFKYYHKMVPEPVMLDGGNEILIAGSQDQWTMMCEDSLDVPKYLDAKPYVIIKREDLCRCKLVSGEFFLQENLSTCRANYAMQRKGPVTLYYTLNAAVAGAFSTKSPALTKSIGGRLQYLSEKGISEPVRGDVMKKTPYDLGITDVKVYDADYEHNEYTLLDSYSETKAIELNDVVDATVNDTEICLEQNDLVTKDLWFNNWFGNGANYMLGVLFFLSLIGTIGFILYFLSCHQWARLRSTYQRIRQIIAHHGREFSTLIGLGVLPKTEASGYESTVIFKFDIVTFSTLVLAQVIVVIILLIILYICKTVGKYIMSDYTESPITMVKRSWMTQVTDSRNTDLILQMSSVHLGMTKQIRITTIPAHPTLFTIEGGLTASIIRSRTHWLYDSLSIPWNEVQIFLEDRLVVPPDTVEISLFGKRMVRKLLKEGDCRIQFILLHNHEYMVLEPKSPDSIFKRRTSDRIRDSTRREFRDPRGPLPSIDHVAVQLGTRSKRRTVQVPTSIPLTSGISELTTNPSSEIPLMSGTGEQLYESFNGVKPKRKRPFKVNKEDSEGAAMTALAEHLKDIDSPETPAEANTKTTRF